MRTATGGMNLQPKYYGKSKFGERKRGTNTASMYLHTVLLDETPLRSSGVTPVVAIGRAVVVVVAIVVVRIRMGCLEWFRRLGAMLGYVGELAVSYICLTG